MHTYIQAPTYECVALLSHIDICMHIHTQRKTKQNKEVEHVVLGPRIFNNEEGRLTISGNAEEDRSEGVLARQAEHRGFMEYRYISQWLPHIANSGVHSLKEKKNFHDTGG